MSQKAPQSQHQKLQDPPLGAVRWTQGFWAERFKLCCNAVIPSMREALETPGNSASFSNFRVAAGLSEGQHQGTNWSDGDCYKWLEAVAHVYGVTHDPELDRIMDREIEVIARAQDADGYISTQVQLKPGRKRWERRIYHEEYNMGHLMTAASVHYRVTGKETLLVVARKAADCLYRVFQPRPRDLVHWGWDPSQIMGLVDLYRVSGDPRYLELAGIFVDMRGAAPEDFAKLLDYFPQSGGDQNQDRTPLREETEAEGHAVTATYLWAGAADVYVETGEPALLQALERLWRDVVSHKMYVTGGVAALHFGASRHHDPVHEAFGRPYELPNAAAYNETCANIGNAMWNRRMLQITGEAQYADVMELVLHNSMLSATSLDGKRFFYTNPLRWYGSEHRLLSQDAHERWFTFSCYCCPPQVARALAWLHEWAYSLSDDSVWVHLYGGSQLDAALPNGEPVKLCQETDYPWHGDVRITVEQTGSKPWALRLRIPGWAEKATIRVNGQELGAEEQPGSYAGIRRCWAVGDVVELVLPMEPRLMQAHPKVEEGINQVAVMRGPVVYCLEGVDLPAGVSLAEVYIPRDIRLSAHRMRIVRQGEDVDDAPRDIVALQGEARRLHSVAWNNALYHRLGDEVPESLPITLIPYYAWNNRGECEMAVWLPLA